MFYMHPQTQTQIPWSQVCLFMDEWSSHFSHIFASCITVSPFMECFKYVTPRRASFCCILTCHKHAHAQIQVRSRFSSGILCPSHKIPEILEKLAASILQQKNNSCFEDGSNNFLKNTGTYICCGLKDITIQKTVIFTQKSR